MKNRIINVKGAEVTIATRHGQDYISLTDMLKTKDGEFATIKSQAETDVIGSGGEV